MSAPAPWGPHAVRLLGWSFLNVVLPSGASLSSYWIARINNRTSTVDYLMEKAFGGADNFLVASIIFVIVFFEVEGEHSHSPRHHSSQRSIAKLASIALAFVATLIYGVLKSHSLSPSADSVTLVQGAQASVSLLLFAGLFAISVKFWLVQTQWKMEGNGHGT